MNSRLRVFLALASATGLVTLNLSAALARTGPFGAEWQVIIPVVVGLLLSYWLAFYACTATVYRAATVQRASHWWPLFGLALIAFATVVQFAPLLAYFLVGLSCQVELTCSDFANLHARAFKSAVFAPEKVLEPGLLAVLLATGLAIHARQHSAHRDEA